MLGDAHYTCGEPPGFLPSLLDQPPNAELENHPSAAALRAAIANVDHDLPNSGYWLVKRDDRIAEYLARIPRGADPAFASATFERQGGIWKLFGWGECRPTMVLDGLSLATWFVALDTRWPDRTTTTFTALVSERRCTSGQAMGARLQPPVITYTLAAVLVVFAARPLEGNGFDCQGNPPSRVVVKLREPLGDRALLDAAFFPPAVPAAG